MHFPPRSVVDTGRTNLITRGYTQIMIQIIFGFIALLVVILTVRTMFLSWQLARKNIAAENKQLERVVNPIPHKKKEKSDDTLDK